jgi:hypothetical protein
MENIQKPIEPKIHSFNVDYQINRLDTRENREATERSKPWVMWGLRNDYPQFILQVKEHSPTMSVAIDAKVNMTYGDGVEIEDLGNVLVNKYETISELYYKVFYDIWLFGGYSLEVIKSRDGSRIESIYHIPFQDVRVGKQDVEIHNRENGVFYVCEDWQNTQQKRLVVKFQSLNMETREGREMVYWKDYTPTMNRHYPLTPYQSSIDSCVLEAEIYQFHKTNLAASLMPNLFVSLIGDPTPEERLSTYEELVRSYQGKNGQKLMLAFSNSADERPVIEAISNTGNDTFYTEILQMCVQAILTGQQVASPLLLGISTLNNSAFSQNAEEINVAWNLMMETTIKPMVRKANASIENILALKYDRPIKLINKFRTPEL